MYLSSRPTFPSGLYHSLIPLLVMPGAGKRKDCGSAENWNKCWRDSNGFRRGADKPTYVSRKKGGCLHISPTGKRKDWKVLKAGKLKAESWNQCGFRRGADQPTDVSRKKGGCLQISPARGPQHLPSRYSPLKKGGCLQIIPEKGPQSHFARYSPLSLRCARPKIWELRKYFRDAINAKTYDFLWNSSKFLQKAGANNPELSLTLARFMEPFWDGDTRYHSIQQPGVRRRVPLHALEKLEEMFCVVDYVRDEFLPTVALMRNQCLDDIDPNTDFSTQELDQILSEWQEEYVMWMPEASKKRYEELLQDRRKGTHQQARQLLRKAHDIYQMHVAGSFENIKLLQHLIQYPSQTDPAKLLPWMKTQVQHSEPQAEVYKSIPFG